MVSVTLRSRNCVLLLLSLTQSILPLFPPFLLAAAAVSLWPALALADLRTPKSTTLPADGANRSRLTLPVTGSTAPASPADPNSSHTTQTSYNSSSISVSSTLKNHLSVFNQTSHRNILINLPETSKTRKFGSKASPRGICHSSSSFLYKPVQHSRLSPHSCKHLTSQKMAPSPSFESFQYPPSKTSLLSPQKVPPKPSARDATAFRQPKQPAHPSLPQTAGPLFDRKPFIVTWNIPDLVCNRYNISLDTSPFKGVATPAKVPGQFLSLFYTDRLGFYPHVNLSSRRKFYGGIPQRSNLQASINKARLDINYYIPSKTSSGLAVIDWEEWRPLWDRNWGTKRVYQTLSVAHAMQTNRSLTLQEATDKAKKQFQEAAKALMSGMLSMGRTMRPNYLWGFYLFPNCYNYGWHEPGYTGRCSKEVKGQNDELRWLWESSTALYPSVYLQTYLADSPKAALMVRNRVQEALRVSALTKWTATAPVFVYTRPVFVDHNKRFLSLGDLISTIGESAAMGASGAVVWGASADYDDQSSCESLASYLTSTINPYVANVTAAAQLCSNYLCRGNGRCVRKNYKSGRYLHLNPDSFRVLRVQRRYLVLGRPTLADLKGLSRSFTCQCYKGLNCTPRTYRELSKALMFDVKHGPYHKANSLTKAAFDDMQQTSITKGKLKRSTD